MLVARVPGEHGVGIVSCYDLDRFGVFFEVPVVLYRDDARVRCVRVEDFSPRCSVLPFPWSEVDPVISRDS